MFEMKCTLGQRIHGMFGLSFLQVNECVISIHACSVVFALEVSHYILEHMEFNTIHLRSNLLINCLPR